MWNEKVTLHFSPPAPGEAFEIWADSDTILLADHTLPNLSQTNRKQQMSNK